LDDPVEAALRWRDLGATRVHVVDLDGARTGQPVNLPVIHRLAAAAGIPVQMGGGMRSLEAVRSALNAGVSRVIIGTSAALEPGFAESAFAQFGGAVVLGVDARDGRVAVHGWETVLDLDAVAFARQMQELGAPRVIFTDISRDGMLMGLNAESLRRMVQALRIPVVASGGVTTVEDVRAAKEAGAEAAILGKALYAGFITLQEAMEAAKC
jgi:phosphoribosylformimino-5-aminoimidazole carboxamide ribotide isomerase